MHTFSRRTSSFPESCCLVPRFVPAVTHPQTGKIRHFELGLCGSFSSQSQLEFKAPSNGDFAGKREPKNSVCGFNQIRLDRCCGHNQIRLRGRCGFYQIRLEGSCGFTSLLGAIIHARSIRRDAIHMDFRGRARARPPGVGFCDARDEDLNNNCCLVESVKNKKEEILK